MMTAEDIDLLALRKVVEVAFDSLAEMPVDAPTRTAAIAGLEAALRRIARVASESRQAARHADVLLNRVLADHKR
jgi:hypothetical protein